MLLRIYELSHGSPNEKWQPFAPHQPLMYSSTENKLSTLSTFQPEIKLFVKHTEAQLKKGMLITIRQEASYGQQYPCPTLYSFWVIVGL